MSAHFTLHSRLIKGCNADCDYCSSYEDYPGVRMSAEDYQRALTFIRDQVLPQIGVVPTRSQITIQYVGGEILLIPAAELRASVYAARDILGPVFMGLIDGVQSNLIASERRVMELDVLFSGRMGTSVDGKGTQRKVKGSAQAYRAISLRNLEALKKRRSRKPGAIFVVDHEGVKNLSYELAEASLKGYSLVLRPVFQGGSEIKSASLQQLTDAFTVSFDEWFMKSNVSVEPFTHLVSKRLFASSVVGDVCPFQRNCASVSLDLEPDGTLYTCLDMADAKQVPLGNALEGRFDIDAWNALKARETMIDPKCMSCPFFAACQGGCMSEAIHHTGSVYGRSEFCEIWTALFKRIDKGADDYGRERVGEWLKGIA